jgi:hypothetical protein
MLRTLVTTPDRYIKGIALPSGIISIGEGAFEDCTGLTSFLVSERNPAYSSVDGVLFDKAGTTLVCYPASKGNAYTISDSI